MPKTKSPFTPYLQAQIEKYPSIARQYLPDERELDKTGIKKPFVGLNNTGIPGLERMYLDRVAIMFTPKCFAYCRFCFRKNYSAKNDYLQSDEGLKASIQYIKNDKRIKEVLITGGDPLLYPDKVLKLCKKLQKIPHLTAIRIGSRIFTSDPGQIDEAWVKKFSAFNKDRFMLSISPHINHPDELSKETTKALLLCTRNNIPLYNQTVLLKDINNDPELLIKFFRQLRQLNVEPYRLYLADPLEGSGHFRISIEEFRDILKYMRAHASGRIVPGFFIDTKVGKIELGADSEIIHREGSIVWIKTPYKFDIFRSVDADFELPEYCELAEDGSIVVEYQDVTTAPSPHTSRSRYSRVSYLPSSRREAPVQSHRSPK